FDILADTLFSGEIAGDPEEFSAQVDRLFETMGRVDPLDLLGAPDWLLRFTRILGRKSLAYFRNLVAETMRMRQQTQERGAHVPAVCLTLQRRAQGPERLSRPVFEDNIIALFVAGHQSPARALGWTLYSLANLPAAREKVKQPIDRVLTSNQPPLEW